MKNIGKNAFYNVIRNLSFIFIQLIIFSYISRILGANGIGKITFSRSIIDLLLIIASFGIRGYGIREGARIRDDNKKISQFVKEILSINMCSVFVSYIILFLSLLFENELSEYREIILFQSGILFFTQIGCEWYFEAIEDYKYITLRSILFRVIAVALTLLCVKKQHDYKIYIYIWTICECGNGVFNYINLRKKINFEKKCKYEIKKHIPPIFKLFAFTLSNNLYSNIDIFMLGFMESTYQVGIYSAASKIIKIPTTIIVAIGAVIMPYVSYSLQNECKEKVIDIINEALDFMLMLAIPMTIGILCLRKTIIDIFCGSQYAEAEGVLISLIVIGIITPVFTFINSSIFINYKKEKYIYISVGSALLSNIFLNLICIPKWHIIGAGVATMIAELIGTIIAINNASKLVNLKEATRNILVYICAALPEAVILNYLTEINIMIFFRLIISIGVSIIVYFSTIYFIRKDILIKKICFLKQTGRRR